VAVVLGLPGLGGGGEATAAAGRAKGPPTAPAATYATARDRLRDEFPDDLPTWSTLLVWALLRPLGRVIGDEGAGLRSRAWLDAWSLAAAVADGLRDIGLDEPAVGRVLDTLRVVLALPDRATLSALTADEDGDPAVGAARLVESWLVDLATARYMGINTYGGVTWFDRDGFARLVRWSFLLGVVELRRTAAGDALEAAVARAHVVALGLAAAGETSGYQVERLIELTQRMTHPSLASSGTVQMMAARHP
jgi:hypothetical protein